jgi:hypothetical protein
MARAAWTIPTLNRAADAAGVVFIGELWVAEAGPDEDLRIPGIARASERPDRQEVIQVVDITRDGQMADRMIFFNRSPDGEIIFEDMFTDTGRQVNFFEPIRRKWAAVDGMTAGQRSE